MGTVFAGVHEWTHRPVAVKVLNYDYACDPEIAWRFLQQARAAAQLKHANVVDVLDMGEEPDGSVYLVLELLAGETLKTRMRRGPLSLEEIVEVLGPIMRALIAISSRTTSSSPSTRTASECRSFSTSASPRSAMASRAHADRNDGRIAVVVDPVAELEGGAEIRAAIHAGVRVPGTRVTRPQRRWGAHRGRRSTPRRNRAARWACMRGARASTKRSGPRLDAEESPAHRSRSGALSSLAAPPSAR